MITKKGYKDVLVVQISHIVITVYAYIINMQRLRSWFSLDKIKDSR